LEGPDFEDELDFDVAFVVFSVFATLNLQRFETVPLTA